MWIYSAGAGHVIFLLVNNKKKRKKKRWKIQVREERGALSWQLSVSSSLFFCKK